MFSLRQIGLNPGMMHPRGGTPAPSFSIQAGENSIILANLPVVSPLIVSAGETSIILSGA